MKKETILGIFIVLILLIIGYFVLKTESFLELFSQGKRYPVYARFTSVAGMYPKAAVRLAGVKIGIVKEIRLEGKQAKALMLISNKYHLYDDCRAIISTFGFVGEKFVEIVYKEEFKSASPRIISPEGEIMTLEPFSLDEVKGKIDVVFEKTVKIIDSIDSVVSDQKSRDSLRNSLQNLGEVSYSLKQLLEQNGKVDKTFDSLQTSSTHIQDAVRAMDEFIAKVDKAVNQKDTGILANLESASSQIESVAKDTRAILDQVKSGKGTAGKLLQEEELYNRLNDAAAKVDNLLKEIDAGKSKLNQWQLGYGFYLDYYPSQKTMRSVFNLSLYTPKFISIGGVAEDPETGRAIFTAMAGKRLGRVSLAAGVYESQLGAAVQVSLWKDQFSLSVYASKFFGGEDPLLKTVVTFSLAKNIRLMAGYQDLLQRNRRDFFLGVGFATH